MVFGTHIICPTFRYRNRATILVERSSKFGTLELWFALEGSVACGMSDDPLLIERRRLTLHAQCMAPAGSGRRSPGSTPYQKGKRDLGPSLATMDVNSLNLAREAT
jgi:hypothetical protein